MTPAEVLAMRNKLTEQMDAHFGPILGGDGHALADWLIESGWVTKEPEEKSE